MITYILREYGVNYSHAVIVVICFLDILNKKNEIQGYSPEENCTSNNVTSVYTINYNTLFICKPCKQLYVTICLVIS